MLTVNVGFDDHSLACLSLPSLLAFFLAWLLLNHPATAADLFVRHPSIVDFIAWPANCSFVSATAELSREHHGYLSQYPLRTGTVLATEGDWSTILEKEVIHLLAGS